MGDPLYRIDLEVADPDALIDEVDRAVRLGVLVPVTEPVYVRRWVEEHDGWPGQYNYVKIGGNDG